MYHAAYSTRKADYCYAKRAVDFWNKQDDLHYIDDEGNTYALKFELQVKVAENPNNAIHLENNNKVGNTFEIVNDLGKNSDGYIVTGKTYKNYKIYVVDTKKHSLTGVHEVGHTLMNENAQAKEHSLSGIMTSFCNSPNRSAVVTQDIVNKIVESNGFHKQYSIWEKIISIFK